MRLLKFYLIILFAGCCLNTRSQAIEFIENKGQWNEQVKFKGSLASGDFYITTSGYKVVLHNQDDITAIGAARHGHAIDFKKSNQQKGIVRSHAYEVKFLYANADAVFVPEKTLQGYSNYYIGNDPSKWASNCKTYAAVTCKNLYQGIDVRYYTGNGKLKYDIIIHPNADISKLALLYDGTDAIELNNNRLRIKTSVQQVMETEPYTYQSSIKGRKKVACSYSLRGNILRFRLDEYDKNNTLIIDPALVFSSFSGSTADNWGFTATNDAGGNLYAGGIVFGTGFPVTNGAFQTGYAGGVNDGRGGGYDIGIMKFNPTGSVRLYATYIGGGTENEQPHSLIADNQGNLIIAGRTRSADFPVNLPNAGPCGLLDIFVCKLSADGTKLLASRKFGGTENDGLNIKDLEESTTETTLRRNYGDDARSEVIIDNAGNICVASCTQSTNFPTVNAIQNNNRGGTNNQDAVILKLSSDLSNILLSTYLGGTGDDAAFVLSQNPINNALYIGGGTTSNNILGNTAGVIYPAYQGGTCDGFIAVINTANQLDRISYMGTPGADIVFGLKFDRKGFPYICGTTTGNWPVVNATYSVAGSKQFIAKLQPDLSTWVYSTIFGSPNSAIPNISPVAFLVDRCENVYVSGWGGSVNGFVGGNTPNQSTFNMPITADAYQPENRADGSDFYFFVLERNATKILYGSYFGQNGGIGEHVDGGTSRFDENGVIYQAMCANCGLAPKPVFPITGNAAFPTNNSSNCNVASVKIAFNLAGVGSSVRSSINGSADSSGCLPLTVVFSDTLKQGKQYIWSFGDNSPDTVTTVPTASHTYTKEGVFKVRLVSVDSSSCNITDTSYTSILVRVDKAALNFDATKLQPCDSLKFSFSNLSVAPPPKNFKNNSFIWDFGDGTRITAGMNTVTHKYLTPGTYNIKLILADSNFCNEPDSILKPISLSEFVRARFNADSIGCAPYTVNFTNNSISGQSFVWKFSDGTTYLTQNISHTFNQPGTYTVKLIATDAGTCNKIDSTTFTINVYSYPVSNFSFTPNPPKTNTPISFSNSSVGGNMYKWLFGDGDSLMTSIKDTIIKHTYYFADTLSACLITSNKAGCIDTTCKPIAARTIRVCDVPNAFTPNGDGVNDYATVRGFEIRKIDFKIYNRWGTLVFQSNDFKRGWDGYYNGKLQPMDVYTYAIDVEYNDGFKQQLKGDITLLR